MTLALAIAALVLTVLQLAVVAVPFWLLVRKVRRIRAGLAPRA